MNTTTYNNNRYSRRRQHSGTGHSPRWKGQSTSMRHPLPTCKCRGHTIHTRQPSCR